MAGNIYYEEKLWIILTQVTVVYQS
jgi:hypothetical protein